jgi:hypothetical protein
LKTYSAGKKLWDKTIYTSSDDQSGLSLHTLDGCFVTANMSHSGIGGYKLEDAKGQDDYWLIKFCESESPQLPVAAYVNPDSSGLCEGACFSFVNTSLNAGSFEWLFPGSSTPSSTDASPTNICYPNSGVQPFQLIASNSDGVDTATGFVTVFPPPAVSIQQIGDSLFVPQGYDFYQWYFNNNAIVNDTSFYHVAMQNGDYRVLVIDSHGCPGMDTVFSFSVGLPAAEALRNVVLYPNPAHDYLNVTGYEFSAEVEISITDLLGRNVYSNFTSQKHISINVSHLPTGVYIVSVRRGSDIENLRFSRQ